MSDAQNTVKLESLETGIRKCQTYSKWTAERFWLRRRTERVAVLLQFGSQHRPLLPDTNTVKHHGYIIAIGYRNLLLTGRRSHSPTSRFPSAPTPVVITEPAPDRTGPLIQGYKRLDGDPGVRILTPGLLQLTVLRHLRQLDTTATSGSERCGASRYWYAQV